MAQFLKVNAGPVANDGIETLIPIGEIGGVSIGHTGTTAGETTITIQMRNPKTTGTYVIKVPGTTGGTTGYTSDLREKDLAHEYNKALTANPGGVVSTLGNVPALKQAPAAQTGEQGKILITQPATFAQYTTCIYTP
jgi:hypothetical protein